MPRWPPSSETTVSSLHADITKMLASATAMLLLASYLSVYRWLKQIGPGKEQQPCSHAGLHACSSHVACGWHMYVGVTTCCWQYSILTGCSVGRHTNPLTVHGICILHLGCTHLSGMLWLQAFGRWSWIFIRTHRAASSMQALG